MASNSKVSVVVIKSFYDLTENEVLRNVGDILKVTKKRADYLVERGLVKINGEWVITCSPFRYIRLKNGLILAF